MSLDIMASHEAWKSWLDTVSEEERVQVAELLAANDATSLEGMANIEHQLMLMVIRGLVDRNVVEMLLPILQELKTTLMVIHRGNPQAAEASFRISTRELVAELKPLAPTYTISTGEAIQLEDSASKEIVKVIESE